MPSLVILKDPSGALGKDIHKIESGEYAIDVLMEHIPNGFNPDESRLILNGKQIKPTEENLNVQLNDSDTLIFVNEVKGVQLVYAAVASVVAVAVSIALAPNPEIPNQSGQLKESPNNQLQGQSNIARTYQAWPLILGSPISYPDLIGEPIEEYIDNIKNVKQFFLIGFGQFEIDQVRTESTPINNFTNANYTQYTPENNNVTVPDYITSFRASEIDGQILKGINEAGSGGEVKAGQMDTAQASFIDRNKIATFVITQNASMDEFKAYFDTNGSFQSTVSYEALFNAEEILTQGTGFVESVTLNAGSYYVITLSNFNGPNGQGNLPAPQLVTFTQGGEGEITAINTPVQCEDLWLNLSFQRGLRGPTENDTGTVSIGIEISELDSKGGSPTGFTLTQNFDVTGSTLSAKFETHKVGAANLNGYSWYRVTIRRTNAATLDANAPDECRAESLQCVTNYSNRSFGDATVLEVNIPATQNATATRQTKVNVSLTSLMPTYNTQTQTVITNLSPSRKMADAILHMHINYFGLPASLLDLDTLYEIQNRLDAINPELARFDYTFDDNDISYQDRLEAILNVARCYTWQDANLWRFGRDESEDTPAGLISRRDIANPDNREYSITFDGYVTQNFDGIRLEYVDKSINKKAYINKSVNSAGAVIDGVSSNPKIIELAGCQSFVQAENRANLEIRKLLYQRETLVETVMKSQTFLDKGDVILYAEQYESKTFDGEILDVTGQTAQTTELIEWEAGKSYEIYYTLPDGSLDGPHSVSPVGIGGSFYFTCNQLGNVYTRDGVIGYEVRTGSRYIISEISNINNSRWRISSKESLGERSVKLTMLNYDERIYEAD